MSRCSQHKLDVLDLARNEWASINLSAITGQLSGLPWWKEVAAPDYQVINRYRETGRPAPNAWILSFPELFQGEFPVLMRELLRTLATAYDYPVDTEFTANFDDQGQLRINLLQCRPLQTNPGEQAHRPTPEFDPARLLFATRRSTMGGSIGLQLARVIYVEPDAYNALPINDRYQVARLVGRLNRIFADREEYPYMLIGPGRWGSSTPSLGCRSLCGDMQRQGAGRSSQGRRGIHAGALLWHSLLSGPGRDPDFLRCPVPGQDRNSV